MNRSIAASIWIIGYSSGILAAASYLLIGFVPAAVLALLLGVGGANALTKLLPEGAGNDQ